MKLRLTPRAAQDLIEIADFIRRENPRAAQRVRATILETLQTLARFSFGPAPSLPSPALRAGEG
jgi:toxin ParE1/3/4